MPCIVLHVYASKLYTPVYIDLPLQKVVQLLGGINVCKYKRAGFYRTVAVPVNDDDTY